MTPNGHQAITEALREANIPAEVTPIPQPGQDFEFLTIRTNQEPPLADVMNTLRDAGLLALRQENIDSDLYDPDQTSLAFVSSEVRTVADGDHPRLRPAARFVTFQDLVSEDRPNYSVR